MIKVRDRSVHPLLVVALATFAAQGCFFIPRGTGSSGYGAQSQQEAMANAQASTDDAMIARVDAARKKAKQNPGGVDEARLFAQAVAGAFELGAVKRKGLPADPLLAEASDALEAAAVAFPDQKPEVMFSKGGMFLAAGKTEDGVTALRASMDAKPSPRACVALIAELDKQGDPKKEIVPFCKKARPNAASDETRFALLDACITHTHAKSADKGLEWAGAADAKFYKEYSMKLELEEQERRRAEEERSARRRAEEDSRRQADDRRRAEQASSQSSAPSAPSGWHLSLKNSCSKSVKLFLGKKPKWGSGTYTSLGSNTISSYSGSAGDMIWIVDDGQNGISSLSPSGSQTMQILASCSGFGPY